VTRWSNGALVHITKRFWVVWGPQEQNHKKGEELYEGGGFQLMTICTGDSKKIGEEDSKKEK